MAGAMVGPDFVRTMAAYNAEMNRRRLAESGVLLVGSVLAWRVAEGVLRRVRVVGRTAMSISEGDLSGRIDVIYTDPSRTGTT